MPNQGPLTGVRTSPCATAWSDAWTAIGSRGPNLWMVPGPLTSTKGLDPLSRRVRAPLYPLNDLPSPRLPSALDGQPAQLNRAECADRRLTVKGPHCGPVTLRIALEFNERSATDHESSGAHDIDLRTCSNERRRLPGRNGS